MEKIPLTLRIPERTALVRHLFQTRAQFWNVHPDAAEYLQNVVRARQPRRTLEIGTSNGLSSIVMGDAAEEYGGLITTTELFEDRVALARRHIVEAGLEAVVTVVHVDALDFLKDHTEKWDFVFLDSGKEEYEEIYLLLRPSLHMGALLIADNVVSHKDSLGGFFQAVRSDTGVVHEHVPIGDGLLRVEVI